MILRREQRADVAIEDEVGLHGTLDRLRDVRVNRVDEFAHLPADVLLPFGQDLDVGIDSGIGVVAHDDPLVFTVRVDARPVGTALPTRRRLNAYPIARTSGAAR